MVTLAWSNGNEPPPSEEDVDYVQGLTRLVPILGMPTPYPLPWWAYMYEEPS